MRVPETGNAIIEEFRLHLQCMQKATDGYRTIPCADWSRPAWEGFYNHLENKLRQRFSEELSNGRNYRLGWRPVPNQSGGFLGFFWHWRRIEPLRCSLYLQIQSLRRINKDENPGLFIRVTREHDKTEKPILVDKALMKKVFELIRKAAEKFDLDYLRVKKGGRFRGGKSANVVELYFDPKDHHFPRTNAKGRLDRTKVWNRVEIAMRFLDYIRAKAKKLITES